MRLSIATLLLFLTSVVFTGCGAAEPGSTVKDDAPGGKPSQETDMDDPVMDDSYAESQEN